MSPGFIARNLHGTIFSAGIAKSACSIHSALHNYHRPSELIFTIPGCISIRISGISGVSLLGLRADVQHVVASDEGIAVLVLQLTIDVLLGLLHGEVHVAILRWDPWCFLGRGVKLLKLPGFLGLYGNIWKPLPTNQIQSNPINRHNLGNVPLSHKQKPGNRTSGSCLAHNQASRHDKMPR